MLETVPFLLVDAFAEQPFQGNPAGVVLGADALDAAQMQLIAREINASETAFLSRLNDLHRPPHLRWFTPTTEVEFCGHATLASAHALVETGHWGEPFSKPDSALIFDTAAGELPLTPEMLPDPYNQPVWWLQMPDPGLKLDNTNPMRTCELLGISIDDLDPAFPAMRTRDDDVIYVMKRWQVLMDMKPRFAELAAWCQRTRIRGLCVATLNTLSPAINVQSRFFAPAAGVNEDPVTGSVHGPLAAMLVAKGVVGSSGGRSGLMCTQGCPGGRSGLVRAVVESTAHGSRVQVGGLCFTTLSGNIRIPNAEKSAVA